MSESRRKALKTIVLGSGAVVASKSVPEEWAKPIVNSVMLPVHAETTDSQDSSSTNNCCDIAGTYCGYFNDQSSIEITVDAEGNVQVSLWYGEVTQSASVPCTGGKFTADFGQGAYADGTVECGTGSISGLVNWDGEYDYTATIDGCSIPD